MQTLVIGIDGGEWSIINQLVSEGKLPNLEKLIDTGLEAGLQSTCPPVSPPAWSSFYTGSNPGKHGIYDFSTFDQHYRRRSVSSADRTATPFWEVLNDRGISTGLFKLPFTYPVSQVQGFFISGFPTPADGTEYAYPPEIDSMIDSPKKLFEDSDLKKEGSLRQFKQNIFNVTEYQTDKLISCLESNETDFVMTVYDGSDRIQHFYWKYFDESHARYVPDDNLNAIQEYYSVLDMQIGRLLEHSPSETNIIVMSDHGFGPLETDINIEYWLEDHDYIKWNINEGNYISKRVIEENIGRIWDAAKSVNLDPLIKSVLPDTVLNWGEDVTSMKKTGYDWEKTSAFFTTVSGQAITINLKNKYKHGSVPKEEYDELVSKLVKQLRNLKHPESNEKLFRRVERKSEIYTGWAIESAPDIILEAKERFAIKGGKCDTLLSPSTQYGQDRSGDHTSTGIFIGSGPAFSNKDEKINDIKIIDIAPTILHLHECPIPKFMDGSVALSVLDSQFNQNIDKQYTSQYGQVTSDIHNWTSSEAENLEENLKNLGYID